MKKIKRIPLGIIGKNFGYNVIYQSLINNKYFNIRSFCFKSKNHLPDLPNNVDIYKSWKKLIDNKKIKAIILAVPPYLHKKVILYAIKKNKHIFCEKPCGLSVNEVNQILKSVDKKNLFISHMVNYELPEVLAFKYFKKIIANQNIRLAKLEWVINNKSKKKTWKNSHKRGGGIIFNYYCHSLFYLEKLFGKITSTKVKIINKIDNVDNSLIGDISFNTGLKINVKLLVGKKLVHKSGVHKITIKTNTNIYQLESKTSKINDQFSVKKYQIDKKNEPKQKIFEEKNSNIDFRIKPTSINLKRFAKTINNGKINNLSFLAALRVHYLINQSMISSQKKKRITIN